MYITSYYCRNGSLGLGFRFGFWVWVLGLGLGIGIGDLGFWKRTSFTTLPWNHEVEVILISLRYLTDTILRTTTALRALTKVLPEYLLELLY